jgi:tetratricopeptide (TPR) repeat protein
MFIKLAKKEFPLTLAFLLLLIGFLYLVLFGGLSYIKREGLSVQFAFEAGALTIIFSGLSFFFHIDIHPVLFMIFLYLVTMRIRLLVDLANTIAGQNHYQGAETIYRIALALFPDEINRLMVVVNQGVSEIRQGRLDEGMRIIHTVLERSGTGYLGIKTETACYYNLAIAYRRKGMEKQALEYFKKVVDTWPISIYGRKALAEVNRNKDKTQS